MSREFPISMLNYGIMGVTKYEWPGGVGTPRTVAHELRRFTMQVNSKPNNNEIPYGYCHCGCGEKTALAKWNNHKRGHIKGEPVVFIPYHHLPFARPKQVSNSPERAIRWNNSGQFFEVPLPSGDVAKIDAESISLVDGVAWWRGSGSNASYVIGRVHGPNSNPVGIHRVITNAPAGLQVDHINGDQLDNRIANLRVVTALENAHNTFIKSLPPSGYRGVYRGHGTSKWLAKITSDHKQISIGWFICPVEAAIARDIATIDLHGDLAALNFPHLKDVFR